MAWLWCRVQSTDGTATVKKFESLPDKLGLEDLQSSQLRTAISILMVRRWNSVIPPNLPVPGRPACTFKNVAERMS